MCLLKVTQKLAGKGTKIYTGWKVFDTGALHEYLPVPRSRYLFRYFLHEGKADVPVNQWLKANDQTIRASGTVSILGDMYQAGFHIYKHNYSPMRQAGFDNQFAAVRVKFRGVVAIGKEADNVVIVAKEMYVPYRKSKRTQKVNKKKK